YSLAAVLYEMLAGEPPFTGPSAQAIAARVINDPPRPIRTVRPALPVPLERAIAAGLAKSPADRPRTARAFVGALARPARERRVSARQVAWMATASGVAIIGWRSEEHTSELQSLRHLVCRLLLEKKNKVF